MDSLSFAVAAHSSETAARTAAFETPHGRLETPAFLPVATYGAVRGISPEELVAVGVQGLLSNTFHLHLRPGEDLIARLGGLHNFMAWRGPILTDSGGFQLHSLSHLLERDERGVRFRSPIDGSERSLTPESCVAIQEQIGADLICVLDEFEPISERPSAEQLLRARESLERTLRWAERAKAAHSRRDQLLFGIVQGGGACELRAESAARTAELGFAAFAIGGLGLGDSRAQRGMLLEAALAPLPPQRPRYLMGLGQPEDLVDAVERGVDLFDCVVPTRNGRHGIAFASGGRLNLRNAGFRDDELPIARDCGCPACQRHSRAYLHHLLRAGEQLGSRLIALHNIAFYMNLLGQARDAITDDRFASWASRWRRGYASGGVAGDRSGGPSDATESAA